MRNRLSPVLAKSEGASWECSLLVEALESDNILWINQILGRLYDNLGNIRQWWDNATIVKFEEKAQCIEDQVIKNSTQQPTVIKN
jgi:hypothetical protein